MRENAFLLLNEDEVTNAIRHDERVITYGNYLCKKYTSEHKAHQIRSNLRAMGWLILAIKEITPQISNISEAFDPLFVDLIIKLKIRWLNWINIPSNTSPQQQLFY